MNPWRRPRAKAESPAESLISAEDVAWRIGASSARPRPALPDSAAASSGSAPTPGRSRAAGTTAAADVRPARVSGTTRVAGTQRARSRPVISGATRRLTLSRDASAILFVIVALILVTQVALPDDGREREAAASRTPSGAPALVVLGATATPGLRDLPTLGPVVDPGLIAGINATPAPVTTAQPAPARTPVPAVVPRPARRQTPRATPRPTPRPTAVAATAGPTAAPTPTASPTAIPTFVVPPPPPDPTASPTPVPTDTPAPTPIASFSCAASTGSLEIVCSDSSQFAEGYDWDFGDGSTSTVANPVHSYATDGVYVVTLTVTNASGSDSTSQGVTVPGA